MKSTTIKQIGSRFTVQGSAQPPAKKRPIKSQKKLPKLVRFAHNWNNGTIADGTISYFNMVLVAFIIGKAAKRQYSQPLQIGTIGRLTVVKNHFMLLETINCLRLSDKIDNLKFFIIAERGLMTQSGDAEALARAILYLSENRGAMQSMIRKAKEFVFTNYGQDRLLNDIKMLYGELLGS